MRNPEAAKENPVPREQGLLGPPHNVSERIFDIRKLKLAHGSRRPSCLDGHARQLEKHWVPYTR
ncbi:hypothetical protein [Candidatus Hadarchaeum sp.]|uniref:hypothetical protein n=1 Tax=Candidatus Hadarchaeum sp. TaxID=2883567 RepID=UPI00319DD9F9